MVTALLTLWMLAPGDVTAPTPPPLPSYVVNDDGTRVMCAPGYISCNWNPGTQPDD